MNKKGFTLVELIVSIVLVRVVMVSMLMALVKLRENYSTLNGCKCPASGTSPYDNHCYISKSCPSGYYLNSTGTSCYKYNYTSYDCPSGFYKINNNNDYCYQ